MVDLSKKLSELAKRANIEIDRLDIGCTLCHSMTETEKVDLEAMIDWMDKQNVHPMEILANVLHDLSGFKSRHFEKPGGDCFCPRSHDYSKVVTNS
ncbi:hypothetical protein KAR91_47525 [Candidatus Pacearchaeota archaeon]|nr:hypothetical protein [Candidatus Pacearchaeota archaeon]